MDHSALPFTLAILIAAILLILSDRLRADLAALLVLVALAASGILSPQEVFSGFSRSAVITLMAISILAEGLQRTGVTDRMGDVLLGFPRFGLIGQTMWGTHFREKYGFTVLAIWRAGRPIRTDLSDRPLQFGDALLLQGPREGRISELALKGSPFS